MSDEKKFKVEYQMFRWGPLLVKTKIPESIRLKFLSEAKASTENFEQKLAGVINKEVGFRDKTIFLPFFNQMFNLYADAQFKWSPEVGSTPETFKQQYSLDSLWANFQRPGDFNPPHDHGGALSEEGDMFIFPAELKHWVFPFKSDCTRISVSGNVADSIKLKNLNNYLKEQKKGEKDEQPNSKESNQKTV